MPTRVSRASEMDTSNALSFLEENSLKKGKKEKEKASRLDVARVGRRKVGDRRIAESQIRASDRSEIGAAHGSRIENANVPRGRHFEFNSATRYDNIAMRARFTFPLFLSLV